MLEHPVIKKPRVIIEQNCETSRCFVLWFGFSEQRESSSSLPEGWGEEEEGKLPFCKSIPRVLPGCPESSKGAFANYNFAAAAGRSSTLRKARASGAHHAEPGGRCTIKRKRSLYRTMNSTVQKKHILYTHASTRCLLRPPPRTDFIIYVFQCVILFLMRDNDRRITLFATDISAGQIRICRGIQYFP